MENMLIILLIIILWMYISVENSIISGAEVGMKKDKSGLALPFSGYTQTMLCLMTSFIQFVRGENG